MEASSASSEPSSPAYLRLLQKNSAVYSSLLKKVTKTDASKKKPPSPSVTPSRREKTWSLSLRSDRAKAPKIPQAATLKRSSFRGSHLCFEQLCVETREIGQGFFGTVFKARHPSLDLDLACKILKNGGMEAKLEFLKEAKMLQTLVHPNLLPLIDCFVNCGNLYLVTPFMPKGSLGSVLRTYQSAADFPWGSRISIALDIAKGMEYLHSQHIVHRDLKADNVLLSEELRAVVADFGLAEEFGPQRRLQQGGTWSIMAPEVLRDKPFDERCDIFSFGILLCELGTRLLSRDVPRTDDFGVSVQQMVDEKVLDEGCPKRFMDLITACCCIEPAERPSFASIVVTLGALTLKPDDGWNALGFKALKRECQVRALSDTGNKQELVKRLSLASLSLSPPTIGPPSSHRVHPLHEHPLCVNPELREKLCSAHLFEGGCSNEAQSPLRYICSVPDCDFALCLDCFADKRPRVQVALGVGAVHKAKLRFEALGVSDAKRLVFDNSPVQAPPPPSLAQSISNLLTPAGLRSKRNSPQCEKKLSPLHRRSFSEIPHDPSPHSHLHTTPHNRRSFSSDNYPQDPASSPHSSRRRQSDEEEENPGDHRVHRRRKSEEMLTASPRNELFRSTSTSSLFAESQPHMFYHNSSRSPSSSSRKSSIAWEPPEQVSPSSRGTHRPSLPPPPPLNSTLRRYGTQRKSSFNKRPGLSSSPDALQFVEPREDGHEAPTASDRPRSVSVDKVVNRALLSLSASPRIIPTPLVSPRRAMKRGVVYACLSTGLEPIKIVELEVRLFADRMSLSPAFTSPNTVTPIKPVFFAPVSSTASKSGIYVPQTITLSLLRCSVEFEDSLSPQSLPDVDSEKAILFSSLFWFRVKEMRDTGEKALLLGCQRDSDRNQWMNAIANAREALRKPSEDPDTVSLMRSLQQQEPSSAVVSEIPVSRVLPLKVALDSDCQAIKKQQAALQALLQRNQAWLAELAALDPAVPPSPVNSPLAQFSSVP